MTDTRDDPMTTDPAPAPRGWSPARRRWLGLLAAVVLIGLIAWVVKLLFFTSAAIETDDAYVAGNVVAITAREAGTVVAIHADNTEAVRQGQKLIDLDPATIDVNFAAAEAELARQVRAVRSDFSAVDEGGASVTQAEAALGAAEADYGRRRAAATEGAISGEELAHAADAVTSARAALGVARSRLAQSRSLVQGLPVAQNPNVLAAIASLRRAAIARSHMHITAPVSGVVAQRTVQLGQQVAAGTPLMAVVPLGTLWVDANFRETQLRGLRVGQPATIKADIYGGDIVYHGRVIGLGAGSGNAFALLPAQNASGNWIKIVQRVPVRIALEPRELAANPLRIGLSVKASVDTGDRSGPRVARSAQSVTHLRAAPDSGDEVESRIRAIIAANQPSRSR